MAKRGKRRRNKQRREATKPSDKASKGLPKNWRTSTATFWSTTCVEVARASQSMHVRDSLDRGGPVLTFDVAEWRAFLGTLR